MNTIPGGVYLDANGQAKDAKGQPVSADKVKEFEAIQAENSRRVAQTTVVTPTITPEQLAAFFSGQTQTAPVVAADPDKVDAKAKK